MHTISDWLKTLDLQAGDRIVDGERTLAFDASYPMAASFRRYNTLALSSLQHPEHWRRDEKLVQQADGSTWERWKPLSRYDDWRKHIDETQVHQGPEPWAELKAEAGPTPIAYPTVAGLPSFFESAWPEIERRVTQMLVRASVIPNPKTGLFE